MTLLVCQGAIQNWDSTPGVDATPLVSGMSRKPRSRWDETPMDLPGSGVGPGTYANPSFGVLDATPMIGSTPMGGSGLETPVLIRQDVHATPEQYQVIVMHASPWMNGQFGWPLESV